jgi:hypothetical protein
MASKHLKMSKEGMAGKRKRVTSIILLKLEIIRGLKVVKAEVLASYNIGSLTVYGIKKQKDKFWLHTTLDLRLSMA